MNFPQVTAMNKRTVRAFALGILFTVLILGFKDLNLQDEAKFSVSEAEDLLKKDGRIILSKEEYEKLTAQPNEEIKDEKREPLEGEAKNEKETSKEEPIVEEDKDDTYQLTIVSGMNTEEISRLLKEANIIDDALQFEQFLIEQDYNRKVQIGSFELNDDMDYEQIAKIITKS
jgi:hypothetical protein